LLQVGVKVAADMQDDFLGDTVGEEGMGKGQKGTHRRHDNADEANGSQQGQARRVGVEQTLQTPLHEADEWVGSGRHALLNQRAQKVLGEPDEVKAQPLCRPDEQGAKDDALEKRAKETQQTKESIATHFVAPVIRSLSLDNHHASASSLSAAFSDCGDSDWRLAISDWQDDSDWRLTKRLFFVASGYFPLAVICSI
jgi:hypothetical protein